MIKIELVKFEAQDVITASVESVPATPLEPAIPKYVWCNECFSIVERGSKCKRTFKLHH